MNDELPDPTSEDYRALRAALAGRLHPDAKIKAEASLQIAGLINKLGPQQAESMAHTIAVLHKAMTTGVTK